MGKKMNKVNVVLADYNQSGLEKMNGFLQNEKKYEVILNASSGTEVLEFLEKNHTDVLILNAILPGLDGVGVIEKIKEKDIFVSEIILNVSKGQVGFLQNLNTFLLESNIHQQLSNLYNTNLHQEGKLL